MNQFPPSSPIAGSLEPDLQNPFYQPSKDLDVKSSSCGLKLFNEGKEPGSKDKNLKSYPTPHPSSTLGRSSSPLRDQNGDAYVLSSDYEVERYLETELKSSRLIDIVLDPRNGCRLAIGRKKSVCDVHLPRGKNISRQHAFISYITATNQVKLECNGTNGLIVSFPKKISHVFIRRSDSMNVFELVTEDDLGKEKALPFTEKTLIKDNSLTSFVLLKGETAIMPYMKDTIFDFRQCEARLLLQDVTTDEEDAKNDTETEDELTLLNMKSDDFHDALSSPEDDTRGSINRMIPLNDIERSPPTPQCKEPSVSPKVLKTSSEDPSVSQVTLEESKLTPDSSFVLKTPTAPKKWNPKTPTRASSTPVAIKNEDHLDELRRRKLNTPSPKKTLKKRSKKDSTRTELTKDEMIESLEKKGINYKELQHIVANHLAFSNVQQVPLFQLKDVNSTVSTLSRSELRALLNYEQSIGVIYRTGKDAAGKPLDEEYYYDLENDPDEDRRQLVASLKGGRSGLRSCRRVHKQYFWKKPTK